MLGLIAAIWAWVTEKLAAEGIKGLIKMAWTWVKDRGKAPARPPDTPPHEVLDKPDEKLDAYAVTILHELAKRKDRSLTAHGLVDEAELEKLRLDVTMANTRLDLLLRYGFVEQTRVGTTGAEYRITSAGLDYLKERKYD